MQETFINYRLIDESTSNIVYFYSINNEISNHQERLERKKIEMMYKKDIPYENLFWEREPYL